MSSFAYARFEPVCGQRFRFDTRVYLDDRSHRLEEKGECVAAIVAKNPGSAKPADAVKPGTWGPIDLNRDGMLPTVRKRLIHAFREASKPVPTNAFVQVWNLFYLCNPELDEACLAVKAFPIPPACPSEATSKPKLVWFAWGGGNDRSTSCLNPFKDRFLLQGHRNSFYYGHANSFGYDRKSASVLSGAPTAMDFAKHPQGLPALPIVEHLSVVLGAGI
jgi:hypothetical protein